MDQRSVGEILSRSHVFFSNAIALLDRGKFLESVMSLQRYADSLFYLASRMHASDCQEFFRLDCLRHSLLNFSPKFSDDLGFLSVKDGLSFSGRFFDSVESVTREEVRVLLKRLLVFRRHVGLFCGLGVNDLWT